MMSGSATDIWFRSELPLREIAERLGFEDAEDDAEDFWEWIIGTVGTARCDLTRTHTKPNAATDGASSCSTAGRSRPPRSGIWWGAYARSFPQRSCAGAGLRRRATSSIVSL